MKSLSVTNCEVVVEERTPKKIVYGHEAVSPPRTY
jgi:hypothetical protein